MRDKYKYIGPVYDFLSNLYSGKNIHRCKTAMLDVETVKPGDRILFAGVGHGRDAIRAAELGAEVTVVDLSETMLRKFADAQHKEGEDVVQLGEHQTTGGADAKAEDTAKDDPRKS